jgi:hypothetical protein
MNQMSKQHLGLIALVAVLVITVLINIYRPFLTTHPASSALEVIKENDRKLIAKQVRAEFADIAEKSLISRGEGFDTDIQAFIKRNPELAMETNNRSSRLVVSEGFDTTIPLVPEAHELRLFYRPDCSYSMSFMPIWLEIVKSLPSIVSVKEINCATLDSNGVSICANWLEYGSGITSVPAIQLVSNISGVKKTMNYTGTRSYQQLKTWFASQGITLQYNPDAEHFTDTNPLAYSYAAKEGFTADDNLLFISGETAEGDAGKLADNYNKTFLGLAQEDTYGNIHDVGKDGFYRATFSRCQPDPQGPEGYQVFTRRGQWGCVVPDANSGISTPFDAAFSAVDSYLSMLPPLADPATGKLTGLTRTDEQRMEMKRGMAAKHSKDIREFGLCDERQLREKYNIYEAVKSGKAKLPDGVSLQDYLDTQESAAAIFDACSL